MKQVTKSKGGVTHTRGDNAQVASKSAEAAVHLLDVAAREDVYEAIRQGIEDVDNGRTRPAREVFLEMRRKYGIKR